MLKLLVAWSLLLVSLFFANASASAQESDASLSVDAEKDAIAKAEFDAGKAAYDKNDWAAAMVHFDKAYALSERPALLYNIGQAADRLRQNQKAITSFEQYLNLVPDTPHRAKLEARLVSLKRAVAVQETKIQTEEQLAKKKELELQSQLATQREDNRVVTKPWFWVLLGTVAVGVGVAAYFIATRQKYVDGIFDGPVSASYPTVSF